MTRTFVLGVVVAAAALASPAAAFESTIVRGVGIGKISIGMTLGQVQKMFGSPSLVDARTTVGGRSYVDRGWEFGGWSVGFLKQNGTYRAAQVATTLRGEKTHEGIGVGSSFKAVVRAYPQAICVGYYTTMGSIATVASLGHFGQGERQAHTAIVVANDRKQMAFLVKSTSKYYDLTKPWYVFGVVVRNSVPGAVDFAPKTRCEEGWQQRGLPYKPRA